jgi:hypothetical protein
VLCAFDLIELDGRDLRTAPIEQRKDLLAKVMRPVRRSHPGVALNEHYEGDGAMIYMNMFASSVARVITPGSISFESDAASTAQRLPSPTRTHGSSGPCFKLASRTALLSEDPPRVCETTEK